MTYTVSGRNLCDREIVLGAKGDNQVEEIKFLLPRYTTAGVDLSLGIGYAVFRLPDGKTDGQVPIDTKVVDDNTVSLSLLVGSEMTSQRGRGKMCLKVSGLETTMWSSEIATTLVLNTIDVKSPQPVSMFRAKDTIISSLVKEPLEPESEIPITVTDRNINIPSELQTIAVASDENSRNVKIIVPRYFDGNDLSVYNFILHTEMSGNGTDDILFNNENGQMKSVEDSTVTLTWVLRPPQTSYEGMLSVQLFVQGESFAWHSLVGTFTIAKHLTGDPVVPSTPSLYEQWLAEITKQADYVRTQEEAIQAVLDNISAIKEAPEAAKKVEESIEDAKAQASAAAGSASSAAGSALEAQEQASQAQQQASAAAQSANSASSSASAAQQSAESASEQATAAAQSADAAAKSEQAAAASAESIKDDTAQSAENARNAAASAEAAASDAARAEEAADRAEQIAGFDPSQFATAEQGKKADTALQPGALDSYALKSEVPTKPSDIGAATSEQGAKADTAVQPEGLADYAKKSEIPKSPSDIGAATAAQGSKADTALQPGALNGYAQTSDIPSKLPNPQSLGIRLGQYGSTTYYDGNDAKTVTITPESIGAQPVGSSGGVQIALLYENSNPTANMSGTTISVPGMSGYDLIGIVPIANTSYGVGTDCSGMQIFRVTQSTVVLSSVSYRAAGPEVQSRELILYPSTNRISVGDSSKFNYTASAEDTRVCVPYLIYGIKF